MKFVILLFLLSSVLSCSAESAESACFDMEKVANGSKNLVGFILQTSGAVTCMFTNFGNEANSRKCMRDLSGETVPVYYEAYKNELASYALDDAVSIISYHPSGSTMGKTTIEEIARQCRYDNDYHNFFPCLLNKFQASCPEIYDFFRQAVYDIGYDV
uniref:Uncharacterized protein n=1 Tax=Strigamia maritima TaxID=126957 RepID=T1IL85_STRMM